MLYSEIRPTLKAGDLVLFSGKGFASHVIKRFTLSKWSHVGLVVRLGGAVMLWESDKYGIAKGVQLVELSSKLVRYDGDAAVRPLVNPLSTTQEEILRKLRREWQGRPYETSEMELIRSAYDGPFGRNEEDLSSLFCSELVAGTLQRIGILTNPRPSNEYTPADFDPEGEGELGLHYQLQEIPIEYRAGVASA